jgi:RHS repeat-associated protein
MLLAILMVSGVVPAFGQTKVCRATINTLETAEDHINVVATTVLECTIGQGAWQQVIVKFLSNQSGSTCNPAGDNPPGFGTDTCTTTLSWSTGCLPDGTYTVYAIPGGCSAGNTDTCMSPSMVSDSRTFSLQRVVSLSGLAAQENPAGSGRYDVTATYHISNAGATDRHIDLYNAKTGDWLGACGAGSLGSPSGTCTVTGIDAGCLGLEVRAVATACATSARSVATATLAPAPTACLRNAFRGCPGCGPGKSVGNPVNVGGGDVALSIPLFSISEPAGTLPLELYYDSERPVYASLSGELGLGWSHSFAQSLRAIDASANYLYHVQPTGVERIFQRGGTTWVAMRPANNRDVITQVGSEYRLQQQDGVIVAFDVTSGHWISNTDRWGNVTSASYDGSGNLTGITDPLGRTITVVSAGTALQQVTLPGGATWRFSYTNGNLTSINDPLHPYPGPAWRTFEYANNRVGEPRLLTSMKDDAGVVLESHTYDSQDRGTSSASANGRDQVTIQYPNAETWQRHVTHQIDGTTTQIADSSVDITDTEWVTTGVTGGCATCGTAPGDTRIYNTSGQVTRSTNAAGVATSYAYDTAGNVLSMTEAEGTSLARTSTFEYAMASWPSLRTKETIPAPYGTRVTTRTLSTDERTLTEATTGRTTSGGATITYATSTAFDARHRALSIDGPRVDVSDVETLTYYSDADADLNRRGRLQSITTAAGLVTTYSAYDVYGTPLSITDPNGVVTTIETDARGRTTAVVSQPVSGDPNETATYRSTTSYDSRDRVTQAVAPRGNKTGYLYEDGTNRLTDTIRYDLSGNQVERLHLTLNLAGWKTQEEAQSCSTPAPVCSAWITKRSDSFTYDDQGRLKDLVHPDATKQSFTYDSLSRASTIKDENHATANTTYGYDALNRLLTATQTLAGAPGGTITTAYAYNVQDQLTSVTDPKGNITTYEYDDFARMTRQTSPVTGTTTYSYDAAGNLLTTTDANNATTTRVYDGSNRATSATSTRTGAATEIVSWVYDNASAYGRGRLTSATDPSGTTTYQYDRRGLLVRENKTLEANFYTTAYAYDSNGNRSGVTYPSGRMVTYTFDHADRPASATSSGTAMASSATYLPFGPLTQLTYGNGTALTRNYDTRYRLTNNKLALGAGIVAEYAYTYDGAGNITAITDSVDAAYNRTFAYDDLNRLITANSGSSLWGTGGYNYDPMGNMTSLTLWESRNATFAYSGSTPKLTSVTEQGQSSTASYDGAGNEIAVAGRAYAYTSRNALGSMAGYSYVHDSRGVRAITTAQGTGLAVSSLGVSPSTVSGGDALAITITLSGPAPIGGTTVSLTSDDQRVIIVPAAVLVAGGATTATLNVTTARPLVVSVSTTIRAFYQGGTTSAAVTVVRVPHVIGVALSPASVQGGNTSTGTATVDFTSSSDTVVALSSSNASVAAVPASVTIPAGSTTATFTATTSVVSSDTSATITATFRGSATTTLAMTAVPLAVSTLTLNPTSAVGGRVNSTGTVTLTTNAGPGGAVVMLASSNTTVAAVPATITVPAGSAIASFTVTTLTVTGATPVTISAAYGGVTQTAVLDVRSCSDWAPAPATLGSDTVYFDDAVPAGATQAGTWTWDTTQKASGTQSHMTLTTGSAEHNFTNYPNFFHINVGDQMVTYVLVDPCNPPREIMLQFAMCCDGWMHRAFWGEDLLQANYGTLGLDRISMGPVPTGGQWVRLTMPASLLSLSGSDIHGAAFNVAGGGHVWFDRTGKTSCTVSTASPPASLPSSDVVWFDDSPPPGATFAGSWNWDTTQKASGTKSHHDPHANVVHEHYFWNSTSPLTVGVGDSLFAYVLLDACDPPNEVELQWYDGSWSHRAYWGPQLAGCGAEGPACHAMGALPAFGTWLRLQVPASAVGLEGHTINGMAFTVYNGHAWFDRPGLSPAGSGALAPAKPSPTALAAKSPAPSMRARFVAWVRRVGAKLRGEAPPSPIGLAVASPLTAQTTATGPTRQYSFYTPELQLMSETSLTDATTPAIAYDYVWLGGEPLAQIAAATGQITYDLNDHLGAPLLQTNSAGAIVWRVEREPYGSRYVIRVGGDQHQPLDYPGQEYNENVSELRYNIFRWYRASWSRYTRADPLGLRAGMNLYVYVQARPTIKTDPFGLFCTGDFIFHYFFGGGRTIDLASVGLLNAYVTDAGVAAAAMGERKAMRLHSADMARTLCRGCGGIQYGGFTNFNDWYVNTAGAKSDPCFFSLGSSILEVATTCSVTADCDARSFTYSCGSQWKLRDEFTNPLSLGPGSGTAKGFNFGSPYKITADWFDTYGGRSSF